jgi:mRNA interferase HigB
LHRSSRHAERDARCSERHSSRSESVGARRASYCPPSGGGFGFGPTVRAFADAHADARQPLFAWFAALEGAQWTGPDDIKARYPSASFLPNNRAVFNIKGNRYRVVVAIKYEFFAVFIRFIGAHAEYDTIDAATI